MVVKVDEGVLQQRDDVLRLPHLAVLDELGEVGGCVLGDFGSAVAVVHGEQMPSVLQVKDAIVSVLLNIFPQNKSKRER